MEYYHYVNIFSTKGLEYILVICFLITFVLFVRRLNIPPGGARTHGAGFAPGGPGGKPVIVVPDKEEGDAKTREARRETFSGPPDPAAPGAGGS